MLVGRTNRRAFIAGLGTVAVGPLAAYAQVRPPSSVFCLRLIFQILVRNTTSLRFVVD